MSLTNIQSNSVEKKKGFDIRPVLGFLQYYKRRRKAGDMRSEAEILSSYRELLKKREGAAK